MEERFMLLPVAAMNHQLTAELRKCNDFTEKYGLQLSEEQINALAEHRKDTLESSGRIEFGGGVMQKIIMEFADSPYLYQDIYTEALMGLQECFYYFKNETEEEVTDDELIQFMKKQFDDECQGSLEYLRSSILENYSRDVRYGTREYRDQSGYEDDYKEFLDWDSMIDND